MHSVPLSTATLTLTAVVLALAANLTPLAAAAEDKIQVLIIDGQNNHEWQKTTPLLVQALKASDRFVADVATTPAAGEDMSKFRPDFASYDVVMSNYNGERWPKETESDFVEYLRGG